MQTLIDTHVELNDLFARHQEALLLWEVDEAARWLERHIAMAKRHAALEEEILVPLLTARCTAVEGASPEILIGEHRKMERFLREFERLLGEMKGVGTNLARRIIALLDREATYKNLVDHHFLREQNLLYPAIDKVTTEPERQTILARFATENGGTP